MKRIKNIFLLFSLVLIGVSCDDNGTSNVSADYKPVLTNISNDVIVSTYLELYNTSKALVNTLSVLETNPNIANLEATRQAWRDARRPWEQSEGFLFGPVDQKGIDPSIDSWPVNETDLNAVLNSTNVLNKSYLDGLDGTLKGFHTIEYLLFGSNGNKTLNEFNARQFNYLLASAQSLLGSTEELYFSWEENHENFVANLINAGTSSIYPSQKSALQEIVNGMIAIADEVANGKINDPYSQKDLTLEESRFSANSKADFSDNIRSIKNAYLGTYKNAIGIGISSIVKEKNSALDIKMKQRLEDAIHGIESIQGTFTSAIFNAPQSVIEAQQKVRSLQEVLEAELLPLISGL